MRKLLTLGVLITTSIAASAEQPAQRREVDRPGEIRAAAVKVGRGINLGNALEAPKDGEWGVQLKAEYFPAIKKAGFATVRLPVRWSAHAQKEAPYTIDAKFAERVDWAVDQALANGLNIIVNVHEKSNILKMLAAGGRTWDVGRRSRGSNGHVTACIKLHTVHNRTVS